jgi:putative membrane protein
VARIIIRWIINAIGIWAAVQLVPGIQHTGPAETLLLIALIFGLVNALVRPFLALLSCPLVIFTLGLFLLVINALMLQLTAWIAGPVFTIDGFWPALWGSLIISVISGFINLLIKDERENKKDNT